jgi:hypothetical protein
MVLGLSLVVAMLPAGASAALTSSQVAAIISLLQSFGADATTIANVQASLTGGTPGTGGTGNYQGIPAGFTFTRNITVGTVSQDVVYLKAVLIGEGCGNGITNTTYYGPKTVANVQCFQNKYKAEISAFAGYTIASTGLVGTGTRAQLNALLSGVVPPPPPPPPPATGGLSVGLSADSPASASVIDATNTNFTKFTLTAGSGAVSISKIYVTRGGLSANATVENIKIIDAETGGYKGSVGSLNVDNRAMITFSPALVIPAGTTKTYYIRAGIVDNQGSGSTVTMGIVANTDIVSNATSVTGAPVIGNPMTVVLLTVGSLTLAEVTSITDTTPDVGDTNVAISEFSLAAGSTESITVESITALKAGTADITDTANIELYDFTHNKSLGTVASWDSEEKATWGNLGLVIEKGTTLRLRILIDIVGGVASTAKTVNCDIVDGSDELISAKGNVYGSYITLTNTWDGVGTLQTINSGALNIAKSASTPATGKITVGSDIILGTFDFDAKGEEMRITSIKIEAVHDMTYSQITNIKIYDENGTIVAGPKDLTDDTTDYATFTDTFIVPIGVHKYTVKAKIADAVANGKYIYVRVDDPYASVTAKGMTSGDTILPTPNGTDPTANTMTVAAGDLDLVTLTTPVTASVARGSSDYIWATGSLSAADSGEDVQVSSITANDDTDSNSGTNGDPDDIDNAEIWADLTTASSSRGDAYETKISNSENLTGDTNDATNAQAFSLTQTITVAKGSFVKFALIGDISASASVTADVHTFTFTLATVTGATSGQDISETASGAGQAMTVTTSGSLTITKASSSPVSDLIVSDSTVTLGAFRLSEGGVEALDVDDLTFVVTGGAMVDTYYLYNGTTLLGTASGGTGPKFTLADGTVTVPKGSSNAITLTLKAKMVDKTSTTNATAVTAGLLGSHAADAVNTTGLSSGAAADSDAQDAAANAMTLYVTKPTFAAVASRSGAPALSGDLVPSSSALVAIFDVTANANDDVTFEASGTTAASGYLIVHVDRTTGDSDGSNNTWTLKDQDGTTLDTDTAVADNDTTVNFDFASSAFTVPAGTTRSLYIYADTTELEDNGDTVQVHLDDDNSGDNIMWSINSSGDYNDGNMIFRGDIYAGSFVNPT